MSRNAGLTPIKDPWFLEEQNGPPLEREVLLPKEHHISRTIPRFATVLGALWSAVIMSGASSLAISIGVMLSGLNVLSLFLERDPPRVCRRRMTWAYAVSKIYLRTARVTPKQARQRSAQALTFLPRPTRYYLDLPQFLSPKI